MNYRFISFESAGGIARLTLNRPEKLNSFTAAMHQEIREALIQITPESRIRVLLLTGAGRGFCAGQDLADPALGTSGCAADLGETVERDYAPLVRTLRALPLPVVCAVNGIAAGAGANLALACDLVIAKRSASFLQPFRSIGLIPDTGGTYFLPRMVGTARALGLAMLGERLAAQQAAEWGLIWKCVDDSQFEAEVEALLTELATAPTLALARIKQAIYRGASSTLEEQLLFERDVMRELGRKDDYREGVDAFLKKRSPEFHGC